MSGLDFGKNSCGLGLKLHKVNLAQITVCRDIKAYKRLYGYVPVSK